MREASRPVRKVVFTAPYDFEPPEFGGRVTVSFRASPEVRLVTRLCARLAIEAGKARLAKPVDLGK